MNQEIIQYKATTLLFATASHVRLKLSLSYHHEDMLALWTHAFIHREGKSSYDFGNRLIGREKPGSM